MPSPRNASVPKKRTKTFTGCWTCRDRGVKCDLGKPNCLRCIKSKRPCQGYGIRLVWLEPDETRPPPRVQTRRLFSAAERRNPVFSEDSLDAILESLGSLVEPCDRHIEPFGVFSLHNPEHRLCDEESDYGAGSAVAFDNSYNSPVSERVSCLTVWSPNRRRPPASFLMEMELQFSPHLQPFLVSASAEERRLFHHWTSHLSGTLLPTPHVDNPFRTIYIPLAVGSGDISGARPGHASLLHCIYAIAGFHLAEQDPTNSDHSLVAVKHYKTSLRYLRQSLNESKDQPEAVFATIILMATIYLIVGDSSNWRIHFQGGRDWLRSKEMSWRRGSYASILYQIFRCMEVIGLAHDTKRISDITSTDDSHLGIVVDEEGFSGLDNYCLDKYYGLPKSIFEALQRMQQIRHGLRNRSDEEFMNIETMIEHAKRSAPELQNCDTVSERLLVHHCRVFCDASTLTLNREFRKIPSTEMQHLVQECTYHLEAIYNIERTVRVCGITWPLFVTACEAEYDDIRARLFRLFDKGEKLGFGSVRAAAEVVRKSWEHKDRTGEHSTMNRQEIMNALGMDLLLS